MGYAIEQLQSIPFEHLIGSPMTAVIKAQGLAARETVSFIKEVGFKPKEQEEAAFLTLDDQTGDADMGDVRYVTFKYELNEGGQQDTATITVPILTIVPIPFIRVDEMTIDFTAKINELTTSSTKDVDTSSRAASYTSGGNFYGWVRFGLAASMSATHSSTALTSSKYQSEYTMNVHVRAVQDDIPKGLSRVLDMLENLIKDSRKETTAATSSTATTPVT